MDLECSKICQGDEMGKYRFRKGGTLLKILMEKYTSLIIIPEKLLGSIPGIGKFNYIYFITLHMSIFLILELYHIIAISIK